MSLRFELPAQRRIVFEMVIPVRWGDMDAMGHVNNTLYFRYMETVRLEWVYGLVGRPGAQGPVIVNAFCNFIEQVEYPADLLARHYVGEIGRSSLDTYITLERVDRPGVIHAEGGARMVWIDYEARKSVPLPDVLRAQLSSPPTADR